MKSGIEQLELLLELHHCGGEIKYQHVTDVISRLKEEENERKAGIWYQAGQDRQISSEQILAEKPVVYYNSEGWVAVYTGKQVYKDCGCASHCGKCGQDCKGGKE